MDEQRPLEFRVWQKEAKCFITREMQQFNVVDVVSHEASFSLNDEFVIYQEWTGLFDRDGKKIFEGDILVMEIPWRDWQDGPLYHKSIIAVVSFSDGAFWFTGGGLTQCTWFHYNAEDRRVVGNIMENSELIK